MELREARQSDFEAITRLIQSRAELFRVYPKGEYPFTVTQLMSLAEVRSDLTVATENDAVIGFANLYDLKPAQSAFIGNVVVDSAYRGKGIGRALVRHMMNLALEKYSLQEIHISVFNENTPALLLYSSLGFSPYAIEERRDPQGARVALIHMALGRGEQRK